MSSGTFAGGRRAVPRLVVEADGGSRGNPGPAGFGAVVRDAVTGDVLAERAEGIGRATNNVAEYGGLIAGLHAAAELFPGADVEVRMDSKLVIEQMAGRWQIKHPDMKPLALQARKACDQLGRLTWTWIPREKNKAADALANAAMDAQARGRAWEPSSAPVTAAPSWAVQASPEWARPESEQRSRTEPAEAPAPSQAPARGWGDPSLKPTTTLLLRHGQTALSVDKRFSGIGDPLLTELGERQAAAAAERLRGRTDVAAVICSPLVRARDTAERVAGALKVPLTVDERLIETDFGVWEGLMFSEVRARYPAEMSAWLSDPTVAPPGGESFEQVGRRVRQARDAVLTGFGGQTVVLVSHVTPIKTLVRQALGGDPSMLFRLHLDLASLSTVDWYADGPAVLRTFNDATHTDGVS